MAQEITGQSQTSTDDQSVDQIDPKAHLHVGMRVLGTQGKALGKVETLDRDEDSGQLSSVVVRHGLFGNKLASVPASRVKWVNSDSVIMDLTPTAFKRLPKLATS